MATLSPKYKAVLSRALRMFIIGAASTATAVSGLITVQSVQSWQSLWTAVAVVLLAVIVGGINGLLAGADKLIRWEE